MHETSDPPVVERISQPPQTLVIPPDDGDTIHAYGDTALVKLSGEQTNGSMVVVVGNLAARRRAASSPSSERG
jgi:hypothetical protein